MLQEYKRSWETGSVISRNSAAMNSYSNIVLETKKGVEGRTAEEKRPARRSVRIHELSQSTALSSISTLKK